MWPGMHKEIKKFVAHCDTCQRQKYKAIKLTGLLQPLLIPTGAWLDISLDFIKGLPPSNGKNVIFIVVYCRTKYAHFVLLAHPYTMPKVADLFVQLIFRLYRMLQSITSNSDLIFLSQFWKAFIKLQGTKLCCSSAYHLQTDGQISSESHFGTLSMQLHR